MLIFAIVVLAINDKLTPNCRPSNKYVGTKEQVADIFTKPLPWEAFEYLFQRLGVISTPKMNAF
jgi:hypothetical protein